MLTHTEFFYDVWAEKIRSKPIPPYGAPPKEADFLLSVLWYLLSDILFTEIKLHKIM